MLSNRKRRLLKIVAALALGYILVFWAVPRLVPYGNQARLDSLAFSLVFLDKAGGELQALPLSDGLRRVFMPLDAMPPDLVSIVLQAEDRRFWLHPGVDPAGVIRAAWQNNSAGRTVSGASTVSMQLARLLRANPGHGDSKAREAWEALQLESRLGKRGALELYLNLVPFGQNVEGFPAAARVFFGKPLNQLTKSELLVLSVIPRSPNVYNPFAQPANNQAAVKRSGATIDGNDSLQTAYAQVKDPSRPNIWPFRAPHFVRWLASQPYVTAGNGRQPIQTAIEPQLQSYLENLLAQTVEEARTKRVSNAAALFVRPSDMTIAAWVGSADFDNERTQGQVDGVTMRRQPGSTLKPFLYSLALEQGFTAASILPDIPTDFGGAEIYTPANFNDQFNGPVRLRQALASSLNVPAVYMLQRLGVGPFTDRLIDLGFDSLKSQKGSLGLGLALGNAEVSLYELVQAYGALDHGGEFRAIRPIAAAPTPASNGKAVIKTPAANLIRDILTRHPDRILAFGHASDSRLKFEGAMKTGTSNQFNNIWAVGFTPDLLGGVWLGNFGGQTVVGTADSGYPAGVMTKILESFSATQGFEPLAGFTQIDICSLSGMAAGPHCPHVLREWFQPGSEPKICNWHGAQSGATTVNYPQEYQNWLRRYRYAGAGNFQDSELAIQRPLPGAVFYIDPGLPLAKQLLVIEATGSGKAEVSIDGQRIYWGAFPLKTHWQLRPGQHRIDLGNGQGSVSSNFEVR